MKHIKKFYNLKILYEEHQDNQIIENIIKTFNINCSEYSLEDINITFSNSSITIHDKKKNCFYIVELDIALYKVITQYPDYHIVNLYTTDDELFRKSAIFFINDHEALVLDDLIDEEFTRRSILITTKEDEDFLKSTYEYENLIVPKYKLISNYEYVENNNHQKTLKIIKVNSNIYYYDSKHYEDLLSNTEGIIETAISIKKPTTNMTGRLRDEDELLESVVKSRYPTIMVKEFNITTNELLTLTIIKKNNILLLTWCSINNNLDPFIYKDIMESSTSDSITIEDINSIIKIIKEKINNICTVQIVKELNAIIDVIKNNGNNYSFKFEQRLKNHDFNHQAFDIYLNLDQYLKEIRQIKENYLTKKL